jgi:peptidoglycan/xylan/chitin deacetylase (PgdA/CDA1 family)
MLRCGGKPPHARAKGIWMPILVALLLVLAAGAPASRAEAARLHEAHLHYRLDYSRVPVWVTRRTTTVIVTVGPALDAVALSGGRALPCRYDGQRAIVTTDADAFELIVTAPSWPVEQMGAVTLATLYDDKQWALSITLDDGYVSQATHAKAYLDRYGYRSTVAVIGPRVGQVFAGKPYASAGQLRELVAAGWDLANHTSSHLYAQQLGTEAAIVRDIASTNVAIRTAVPGYVPRMFTAPFVDTDYNAPVRNNVGELGLHLIQSLAWEGRQVDKGVFSADDIAPTMIGRTQLLYDASQFDQVQTWMRNQPGTHWWLSLHTHEIEAACDCVETATDALYYTYGAGGLDNVWVAPAPQVYEYLLVRDRVRIMQDGRTLQGQAPVGWALPTPVPTPYTETLVLQQGLNGYQGTRDSYVDSLQPTNTQGASGALAIRTQDRLMGLIAFDVSALPADAVIERAVLKLYGLTQTNDAVTCLDAHLLLRPWTESQVNWNQASAGQAWQEPGAAGAADRTAEHTGLRGLAQGTQRWYAVDLTEAVRGWQADPSGNHGVLLRASGTASRQLAVASAQSGVVSQRPRLEIRYHRAPNPAPPTPPSGDAMLVGRLQLDGRGEPPSAQWRVPVTVSLATPGGELVLERPLITGDYGQFSIEGLAPGTYDVGLQVAQTLPLARPGVTLHSGLNLLTFGPLVAGDVVPDGYIAARDWAAMLEAFGRAHNEPGLVVASDLNQDGRVDVLDMAILYTHYGRYGEVVQLGEAGEATAPLTPTARLWLDVETPHVRVGQSVRVALRLDTGGYGVNGVDLPLRFDPTLLQMVAIATTPDLPIALNGNDLDGADGRLRYVAGNLSQPLSGTVTLLEMRLVARRASASPAPISFDQPLIVAALGDNVLAEATPATLLLEPARLHLPVVTGRSTTSAGQAEALQGPARNLGQATPLSIVGHYPLEQPVYEARDVRLRDGYAYVAVANFYAGHGRDPYVQAVDVRDPRAPRFVSAVEGLSQEADELWIEGDRIYVARKGWGADVLGISLPGQISRLGSFFWTEEDRPIAKGIHALDQRMYIADERYGLQIVDVSDGARPRLLGSYDEGMFGEGVWSDGVTAWVAADRDELYRPVVYAIDVTNPARPRLLNKLIPPEYAGRAVDVQKERQRLYIASELGGVSAFDVSQPAAPVYLGAFRTSFAQKIDVVDDLLYVADDANGLIVLDVSTPSAMRALGYVDTPGRAFGVSAVDGYAYVADGTEGLQVVDLSPLTPTPTPTPTLVPTATPTPTATPALLWMPLIAK